MPKPKINIRKLIIRLVLLVLLASSVGLFFANRFVKKYGYDHIGDFISNYFHNKNLAEDANPVEISISVSDKDYDFLKRKRQEALDRGIQINKGDNYVDCEVKSGNEKIKAEVRLKGHMTDHLQGDKWSFRVKSDEPILGMYRFSLQHPGTRGYIYEWVYHQLLKQEDIIYLHYDFVHLTFKDKDLGIYALEEHFGQHLPARSNRPKGAILRWNPGLYWEWRIDAMQDIWVDEEFSSYISSFAEPYDRGTVKDDPELIATYLKGAKMLEAFRRDSLSASEVFDIQKMARFHAIIDLVGGHHSLDWSDVKFFYNSETDKIEPVGYESFSIRKSERLAGQRTPDYVEGIEEDYHNKLFADPIFFKAYIQNLERIADETYVHDFENNIKDEFNDKMGIIALEWPHRKFSFDGYYENVELIRHNLSTPKPFHAFINAFTDSTVQLSFAPVSDFPIQIIKVDFSEDDEKVKIDSFYLPPKPRKTFTRYYTLDLKHDNYEINNIFITAKIPGSKNKFKVQAAEYPSYDYEKDTTHSAKEIVEHQQAVVNDNQVIFKGRKVVVDQPYLIKEGFSLKVFPAQELLFEDNGKLIVKGGLNVTGEEEEPVLLVNTTDENCISILSKEKCHFVHCVFNANKKMFRMNQSAVLFQNCSFTDIGDFFLTAQKSKIDLKNCQLADMNTFAHLDQCEMKLHNVYGQKIQQLASLNASYVSSRTCTFDDVDQLFDLNHISNVDLGATEISNAKSIATLQDASRFAMIGGKIENIEIGFLIKKQDKELGESSHSFYKTKQVSIGRISESKL